ncbi:MAG TPA: histidine kinase [Bryobacteraceae bacterium]|nr:histidine kinase [Bryobacteraceae bacterium]
MRQPISRLALIRIALLFAAWTAYGILNAWQAHYWYAFSKTPMSWEDAFRYELTYAYLWGAMTPLILWFAKRFRFERHGWPRRLLIHAGLMVLTVAAIKIAFDAITMPPTSAFRGFTWEKLLRSVESTFDTGTLLYAVVVLIEHAIIYHQRYQSGVTKAAQLQTQLIQAQLQALKMQLHPHFLFNTLHTITALVHEDPDMAELTITRLSELLRLFLANSTVHEAPLSEELRILDLYLEIERARFEERLRVEYHVPPLLCDAMVPSLILQPLVENSIRHGIGRRAEPGCISIVAELQGEALVLRIVDNGVGLPDDSKKPVHQGMGLAITRGRLESLYGPQQSLVLRNLPHGGAEARIILPFREQAATNQQQEKDHVELQSTDR